MIRDRRAELRALALWHSRRRVVDEVLAPLMEYGPIAVDRVADQLDQLIDLVGAESEAFRAFVTLLDAQPAQAQVLTLLPPLAQVDAD